MGCCDRKKNKSDGMKFMVNVFERGNIQRCQRGKVKLPQIYFQVCVPNLMHTQGKTERVCIQEKECCKYIYIDI
jgi:hypothetical protein